MYYRVDATKVHLEVKCPTEETQEPLPTITLASAGRMPDYQERLANVRAALSGNPSLKIVEEKKADLRLKDALVSAHLKFKPVPDSDDLNILFLACGDFYKMSESHGYLFGRRGLFTGDPFHPPETFRNVDCIILSNLKYRHETAFEFSAWSLDDVLLIPIVNPHGRKNVFDSTITTGLSIFKHYRKDFLSNRIVRPGAEEVQEMVAPQTKVTWFVDRQLDADEKKRFFPIPARQGGISFGQ